MNLVIKLMLGLLSIGTISMLILLCFLWFAPVFGGKADKNTYAKMQHSPNFDTKSGKFTNLEPIIVNGSGAGVPDDERLTLMDFLVNIISPAKGKHPTTPLPTSPLADNIPTQNHSITWLGHSTVLFKMGDKTVITDPVFYRASPIALGGKAYEMTHPPKPSDLPPIDVVIISHDHYDHLDMKTIKEIHHTVKTFFVPLGVKAHLIRWGVDANKIHEFAWHESQTLDGLTFIYVPARHYGGRRLGNKSGTLWGGWVVKSHTFSLYFTGDSGFGKHFKEIGERYAPDGGFDLVLVENGQYNINWADVHMFPEQSVQAAIDSKGKLALPIHWGKYDLAYHAWHEPIVRFSREADAQGVAYITPKIGQNVIIDTHDITTHNDAWWHRVR